MTHEELPTQNLTPRTYVVDGMQRTVPDLNGMSWQERHASLAHEGRTLLTCPVCIVGVVRSTVGFRSEKQR